MRTILFAIVTLALAFSFAPAAEATRVIAGHHYKDVCHNIKGKQPIYLTVGTGRFRLIVKTPRPYDCRVIHYGPH